jgi:tyrosinase
MQNDTPAWYTELKSSSWRSMLIRDRSLYIQALTAMQNMDASDELSYFQVAGIHGRPYITWNNASAVGDSSWGGYCTHGK